MPGTEFLVFNVELLDLINFVDDYKYTEVEILSKCFAKAMSGHTMVSEAEIARKKSSKRKLSRV